MYRVNETALNAKTIDILNVIRQNASLEQTRPHSADSRAVSSAVPFFSFRTFDSTSLFATPERIHVRI